MSEQHVLEGRRRWFLHKGDGLELLRRLPDESVDFIATDPPYSSGGVTTAARQKLPSKKYVQTHTRDVKPDFLGDQRDQLSFITWCQIWMQEAWRVAKKDAVLYVFSDWRQWTSVSMAMQSAGWIWRSPINWEKATARPIEGGYNAACEYVHWSTKGPLSSRRPYGTRRGLIRCGVEKDRLHMTGKPRELMRQLLAFGPKNALVVDPFAGGGTTGAAALDLGHRFLGAELEPTYHALSTEWLREVEREEEASAA